jgi:hypothetical protein
MPAVKKEGSKVYIEGVRKVSWDTGEMSEFASSLVSAMRCLGEDIPYAYVMGISGSAFRFTLNPGEWDFGNYSVRSISTDPYEPIRRAIDAIGYGFTLCEKGPKADDTAKIMDSIARGIPVLAFQVVGPSDCCIITGYDENGEVLLGWSTYQDIPDDHNIPHDTTGYFRKPGWHDHIPGYVLIGSKLERPNPRTTYLDALRWAVHLMRTPKMGNLCTGFEALKVWAEEMVDEEYFPPGDEQTLGWRYVSAAVNMTMLRDHCLAEPFLHQAAQDVSEFEPELIAAANCYGDVNAVRNRMDDIIGDNFTEKAMKAIADPAMRQAYAEAILQISQREQEAITHIERLIKRCG